MNNKIIINRFSDVNTFEVVPLKRKRDWMTDTNFSYAYQCLPLNIANEYGWAVLCPTNFSAEWNGGDSITDISISYDEEPEYDFAQSHFGHGILTISLDFIIKTPRNISLYIRGIPNSYKENIHPLDAIVETDWLPFTFTYNYRITKPSVVRFEKNTPLFSFFPVERGRIENYEMISLHIDNDEKLKKEFDEFSISRSRLLHGLEVSDNPHQRYYIDGIGPSGNQYDITNHLKAIKLNRIENN